MTNNPTEQQATPTSEEELDEILAKHGAEAGELTASLKDALLAWKQQELERAVAEARIQALRPFVKALRDPGSHPAYHFEQVERLKSEWPTLYHLLMHAEDDLTNKKEGK